MKAQRSLSIVAICFLILVTACDQVTEEAPEPTPVRVQRYTESTALELYYPVNWISNLVDQGLLVVAPVEVISISEPGPSVTIYRIPPEKVAFSLEEHLDRFLENGPIEDGYTLNSEADASSLGQYSALRADFRRDAGEDFIGMMGYIVSVKVASGAIYHFVATTPIEQWEESWPLFSAIFQNVTFNE